MRVDGSVWRKHTPRPWYVLASLFYQSLAISSLTGAWVDPEHSEELVDAVSALTALLLPAESQPLRAGSATAAAAPAASDSAALRLDALHALLLLLPSPMPQVILIHISLLL